jgi:hypothetical protein
VRSNDCKRRFSAYQRLGVLKLQCFEQQQRSIELVRWSNQCFLHWLTELQLFRGGVSIFVQFCH